MPWLYRQKKSRYWWLGWRTGGKIHFRSTETSDLAEAKRILARQKAQFELSRAGTLDEAVFESLTGGKLKRQTLASALREWLQETETSASIGTLRRYQQVADSFGEFLGATETRPMLQEIEASAVRGYLVARLAAVSASTVNLEKRLLSGFFARAVRAGDLRLNPVASVKSFRDRIESARRRTFTLDELRLIYSRAPSDFWRFMILGGFFTLLRMGDLVCLVCGAFDLSEGILRLRTRKTSTPVKIPIHPEFLALVEALKRSRGASWKPASFVWPEEAARYQESGAGAFSNAFYSEVLVPAGLVPPRRTKHKTKGGRAARREFQALSFHCLRHTGVSLFKAMGGSQAIAKAIAGHASDAISDHYTQLPLEVMAREVAQLPRIGG